MKDILPLARQLRDRECVGDVANVSMPLLISLCIQEYESRLLKFKIPQPITLDNVNIKPYEHNTVTYIPILKVPTGLDIEVLTKKLENEINYVLYLNIQEVILEASCYDSRICSMIRHLLSKYTSMSFSLKWNVPSLITNGEHLANWVEWTNIKLSLKSNPRISLCLMLTDALSSQCFNLWAYEQIRYVHAISDIGDPNSTSFVLFFSFLHQLKCLQHPFLVYETEGELEFIKQLQVNVDSSPPLLDEISLNLRNQLSHTSITPKTLLDSNFILQSPLKPTVQNLSGSNYEVFENDKYKYKKYGNAILSALIKLKADVVSKNLGILDVICVGPGRGPLIDEFFQAIKFLNLEHSKFNIVAVERNMAVMPFLEYKNLKDWNGKVSLYCDDIRKWKPRSLKYWTGSCPVNEKDAFSGFHLIFSELIGSFGCNELMPEVLNSLVVHQNKSHCIWIPQSLECYLAPVHSPWLWQLSRDQKSGIYVPMIPEYHLLIREPQLVWKFDYYDRIDQCYSKTYKSTLKMNTSGQFHGFCGYFRAILFPGIEVDNIPKKPLEMWTSKQTQSNSWLPIYFSLEEEEPEVLYYDDLLHLFVSRRTSSTSLFYHFEANNENISFNKTYQFDLF